MRALRTAVVGLAMIALAGCSGGGDDGGDTAAGATAEGADASTTGEEQSGDDAGAAGGGEVTVEVASTSLGDVLVDGDGMTLYMFDSDSGGTSTCYDDCAAAWPPLLVEGDPVVGEGLDESLIGTVSRDDGTMQVVYGEWPLYLWQNDAAPGDVTGQAVGDVWWVVGPDGEPIRTPATS